MPIYGKLILQSRRCSPAPWAVALPSQFRSILEENEFGRVPEIYLISFHRRENHRNDIENRNRRPRVAWQDIMTGRG